MPEMTRPLGGDERPVGSKASRAASFGPDNTQTELPLATAQRPGRVSDRTRRALALSPSAPPTWMVPRVEPRVVWTDAQDMAALALELDEEFSGTSALVAHPVYDGPGFRALGERGYVATLIPGHLVGPGRVEFGKHHASPRLLFIEARDRTDSRIVDLIGIDLADPSRGERFSGARRGWTSRTRTPMRRTAAHRVRSWPRSRAAMSVARTSSSPRASRTGRTRSRRLRLRSTRRRLAGPRA